MIQFEIGKTYGCRSICDSNCIFEYEVLNRTAKQVTLRNWQGEIVRRGVQVDNGEEFCRPEGSYSMAPVIRAGRMVW